MKIEPVLSTLGRPGLKKDIKIEPDSKTTAKPEKLHPDHKHSKMEEEIMNLTRSRLVRVH